MPVQATHLSVPGLTPAQVRLGNLLYRCPPCPGFLLGGWYWNWQPQARCLAQKWRLRVYAKWGEENIIVFLDNPLPLASICEHIGQFNYADLPEQLQAAAVETILEEPLNTLERLSGQQIRLENINAHEEAADIAPYLFPFVLTRQTGPDEHDGSPDTIYGALSFSSFLASDLSGGIPEILSQILHDSAAQANDLQTDVSSLPLRLRLELPCPPLSITELGQLAPRDILLLPGTETITEFPLVLRIENGPLLRAELQGTQLTLKERIMTDQDHLTDGTDTENAVAPEQPENENQDFLDSTELDNIELPVCCEVETLRMSLAQVKALKPGVILETSRSIHSPLQLKINGQTIGSGELVEVAGRAGIRILSLNMKKTEQSVGQ